MKLSLPALLKPASLRHRLWQGAVGMAVFIGTIVIGNFFIAPDKALDRHSLGQDFIAFYTAGTFAREGRFDDIYNFDAVRSFQHSLAKEEQIQLGDAFGPFWNPPFYAWTFAGLSKLNFYNAVARWTFVSIAALGASLILLCRMLPSEWKIAPQSGGWLETGRDWRNWVLVPLITLVSMPLIQSLGHGQNSCMSLFLLCLLVAAWRGKQPELAGMACGLLFYKPQLAAVLAVILTISLGLRALAGLAFVGGVLLAIVGLTMPGAVDTYLTQLPHNIRWMQVEHLYLWERHVTLKAFWRLLIQGHAIGDANWFVLGLTYLSCAGLGFLLLRAAIRSRRGSDEPWTGQTIAGTRDQLIAATIASMPLLMPFYFDYDLLLLTVPGVLVASEMLRRGERTRSDRWVTRTFVALFIWLMFNPALAKFTHVNGTVILLGALAVQLVARAACQTTIGGGNVPVDVQEFSPIYRKAA